MTLTEFLVAQIVDDESIASDAISTRIDCPTPEGTDFIERHGPERVLAECEAKRRIIACHEFHEATQYAPSHCACQVEDGVVYGAWPCDTMRALALPYASHPDYEAVKSDV